MNLQQLVTLKYTCLGGFNLYAKRLSYLIDADKRRKILLKTPEIEEPSGEYMSVFLIADTHVFARVDGDRDASGAYREEDKRYYYASGGKLRDFIDQVNDKKPDLVVHLGDLTQTSQQADFDLFNDIWDGLDSNIPRYLIPGNHDVYQGYQHMIDNFGVGKRIETAGSKFNYTFNIEKKGVNLKVILVDTNQDLQNETVAVSNAFLSNSKKTWIRQELESADNGQKVMLCLHHGAHSKVFNGQYFFNPYAQEYIEIINEIKKDRRDLHIFTVFGHSHPFNTNQYYTKNISQGVEVAGALLNEKSYYAEIKLYPNSDYLGVTDCEIVYPYP